MMKTYESMPAQINAVQFTSENKDRIYNSLTGQYAACFENGEPVLKVKTSHGDTVVIRLGDWIVQDFKIGTYYPIRDEVFQRKYREVE